jgi:catechol 2,3-dioxygenase-like lactoylglutathione lyase family enzyme
MLTVGSVVLGARDVPGMVEFWQAALDYRPREEPSDDWAVLVPRDGQPGQQIAIMMVTSVADAAAPQRHHLDLYTHEQAEEVERLVGLGAQRVDWDYPPDADYVVLADPDGNRFCVAQK